MIKKVVVVITVFMLVFSFPLIQVFGATPFVDTSIRVSDAVKNLPGYGWKINDKVLNYVDFDKKQYVQMVGMKILNGTENWILYNSTLVTNAFDGLAQYASTMVYTGVYPIRIASGHYAAYAVTDNAFTVDEWKSYISKNPITVYYELITPIITDISDLLPNDEYIYGTSGTIGNFQKVQAFTVNNVYDGDKIYKHINVNLDNSKTYFSYKLNGVDQSSTQIGNDITVDINTESSDSITSYYQTSYLFGYGDNYQPLFFDFGAVSSSFVANFKVKYNLLYYFDSAVEGDYMTYAIYFKNKNGETIGAHVVDYDFQNNGDYSIDDEFSVVVPTGTVCFNVIYRTNLVNQSTASYGYSDFFYNMSFEEFSFTIEDSVYDQLYNDPQTETEANEFDNQMNSTINKGHQAIKDVNALNKPKPNEIASKVDPLSQVDSTIYNNYMTLFTPILNSKFVLPMLLISFSVALVGYVLFGKRG